jgi:hypothetical protein
MTEFTLLVAASLLFSSGTTYGQALSGEALIRALKHGGYRKRSAVKRHMGAITKSCSISNAVPRLPLDCPNRRDSQAVWWTLLTTRRKPCFGRISQYSEK